MRKKYNLRKIVSKRCYTTEEIAGLLNVHVQTVRTWRKDGMQPIEGSTSPYLFLGSVVKAFLAKELSRQKVKLSDGEFYCLRCNKAVKPTTTRIIDRKVTIGKGKQSIFFAGNCPNCDLELRRFATKDQVKTTNTNKKVEVNQPKKLEPKQKIDVEKGQMSLF